MSRSISSSLAGASSTTSDDVAGGAVEPAGTNVCDDGYVPQTDTVFSDRERGAAPFAFDQRVARAFDNMAQRSIPGYDAALETVHWLAARELTASNAVIYDLGASTGALAARLDALLVARGLRLIAVDLSADMVAQGAARSVTLAAAEQIVWRCEDVRTTALDDAALVVSNYCLQFLQPDERPALLSRIFAALRPGAFFVLSEKTFEPGVGAALFQDRYDAFKRAQGYAEDEIRNKRAALEGVLQPWTVEQNERALEAAGFEAPRMIGRSWNFVTWIARKPAE